jgi:hypothetical protein
MAVITSIPMTIETHDDEVVVLAIAWLALFTELVSLLVIWFAAFVPTFATVVTAPTIAVAAAAAFILAFVFSSLFGALAGVDILLIDVYYNCTSNLSTYLCAICPRSLLYK